ncbi:MAG: hypothetical protein AAB417_02490 [Patescibacteria group bacterium]
MPGFEGRPTLGFHLEQKPEIRPQYKAELKALLRLEQALRHPEMPDAVRGFEGIKVGNAILKEKGVSGVLIGGLAEAVWRSARPQDLARRKDTDILVLTPDAELEDFEGGIDWWTRKEEHLEVSGEFGKSTGPIRWWENANGIVLGFRPEVTGELESGLYVLSPEEVISMRLNETTAQLGNADVEQESLALFETAILKRLGRQLMVPEVADAVGGRILSQGHGYRKAQDTEIKSFRMPTADYGAIKKFKEGSE